MWTDLSSVLSQFTRLTDGGTDRRTAFSSLDRVCIPCSAVKIIWLLCMQCWLIYITVHKYRPQCFSNVRRPTLCVYFSL